ncbi:Hsp20 family protein, partial [Francisella tularensis subsp. holarctica]
IEAKYSNGLLSLNIPKKEKDNTTKKISITS